MNLSEISVIIQNLKEHGFTSVMEKFIAVVIALVDDEETQQCEIVESLQLTPDKCRNALKRLEKENFLKINGRRDKFCRPTELLVIPKALHVEPEAPHESPSSAESPLNLSLVNLTELNLTNKQDFEISFLSQARRERPLLVKTPPISTLAETESAESESALEIPKEGEHSAGGILPSYGLPLLSKTGGSGRADSHSPLSPPLRDRDDSENGLGISRDSDKKYAAPAPTPSSPDPLSSFSLSPSPPVLPQQAHGGKSVNDVYHLTESAKAAQRAARAAKREREAKEQKEHLERFALPIQDGTVQDGTVQDVPLFDANPVFSLDKMIQNMQGKEHRDPEYKPIEKAPLIPMYEAFVKTINRLWSLMFRGKESNEKTVNDFVLHRAAYMLVDGFFLQTGAVFFNAESFVRHVRLTKGKHPLYTKMVCMTKDCYEKAGLGWDSTILSNADTFSQELLRAKYLNVLPRYDLFPSYRHNKGLLKHMIKREEDQEKDRAEMEEIRKRNAEIERQSQEKRAQEWTEKREAKERAQVQNAHYVYHKIVYEYEQMSPKDRESLINATYPSALMMKTVIEQMPIQYRVVFVNELLTPAQRKKYGVKKISGVEMG